MPISQKLLRSLVVRALHPHHRGVGSIPAGEPKLHFSHSVPGLVYKIVYININLDKYHPHYYKISLGNLYKIEEVLNSVFSN